MQSSPWPELEAREGVDWPNPATAIAGGEVRGASEVEQVKAHQKVLVAQLEVAGKGVVDVGAEHGGEGARRRRALVRD